MPIQGADPRLDPNSDQYDPRLDENSEEFDQAAYDDYAAQQDSTENQSQSSGRSADLEPNTSQSRADDPQSSAPPPVLASGLPPERDPEKAWQDYAIQAVNGLYPRLRNGIDYAIGRKDRDSDIELLEQGEGVNIDWGKVEEGARKLADADPYAGGKYKPQKPLHSGSVSGKDQGEVPYRRGEAQPEAARQSPGAFVQPEPPPDPNKP